MSNNFKQRITIATFMLLALLIIFVACPPIIGSLAIAAAMTIMTFELYQMFINRPIVFLLLAPMYPIAPCLILIYFNQVSDYKILLYYLLLIVFTFDSASYFTGSICSKFWTTHKIIPSISPNKSWEGAIGGYLTTTLLITFGLSLRNLSLLWRVGGSTILCTIAFAGDIFESFLKRSAGVKDSGTLLPGHGGFLDRFDAILITSFFLFAYKDYLLTLLK